VIRLTVLYNLPPGSDEEEFLRWRLGEHQEANASMPGVLRTDFGQVTESPLPGRYSVTSKSQDAISYNWLVTMEHMVRFTTDSDGDNIGFHSIPRGWRDTPVQTEADLGEFASLGCVRQRDDKAERLYQWASIGTPVVVIA